MILTIVFVFDLPSVGGRFERLNDLSSRHSFSIEEIFRTIYQNHCHTAMKALFFHHAMSPDQVLNKLINFYFSPLYHNRLRYKRVFQN